MAHPECDAILDHLLRAAGALLSKNGDFLPFGAIITSESELKGNMYFDGDEYPTREFLITRLTEIYRSLAASGEIRAAGLAVNMRIEHPQRGEKVDAIMVGIEHITGEAYNVYMPYKETWSGRTEYEDLIASARFPEFFPAKG